MRRMDQVPEGAMKDDGELPGRCAHYIAHPIPTVIHERTTLAKSTQQLDCQLILLHESCLHVLWIGLIFFRCTLGSLQARLQLPAWPLAIWRMLTFMCMHGAYMCVPTQTTYDVPSQEAPKRSQGLAYPRINLTSIHFFQWLLWNASQEGSWSHKTSSPY